MQGYTRDGLWLIERGKLVKPVQNMRFTESILLALNNVEALGPPQRVFHPMDDRFWERSAPNRSSSRPSRFGIFPSRRFPARCNGIMNAMNAWRMPVCSSR